MGRSRGEGGRGHNRGRGPRWRPRAFRPLLGEGEPQDPSRLRPGSLGAGRGSRCPGGQEWARVIPACRTVLRAPGRGGSRACSPGRGPHSWSCPLRPAQPCGVAGCSELVGAQATVWRDEDRPQVLGVSEDRGWGLGRWDPLGAQAQGPGGSGCQGPSASAGAAPRSVLPSLAVGVETPPPKGALRLAFPRLFAPRTTFPRRRWGASAGSPQTCEGLWASSPHPTRSLLPLDAGGFYATH